MIPKADPSSRRHLPALGADVGATLVKLAIRSGEGPAELRLLPSRAIERLAREVESAAAKRVCLTGCGAAGLARLLEMDTVRVNEFEAWRIGAETLLREQGFEPVRRYILVSVGTGTSILSIDGVKTTRIGGTSLGGGSILGLGAALAGTDRFDELAELAARGDRTRVDLLIADIDPHGELPLPGAFIASAFAKLTPGARPEPADVAQALMGLVGEGVGFLAAALAAAHDAPRIAFAGSALRHNPVLANLLRALAAAGGREAVVLENGEFSGALGALALAER